ncbi:MAG: RNA methyltransferase [Anaerolineae bacterium]
MERSQSERPVDAEQAMLEGAVSVEASLWSRSRPIEAVYLRRDRHEADDARIERLAKQSGVSVYRVDAAEIDERAQGKTHGGVLAYVGPRRFVGFDELLSGQGAPFVAMLDGVEDPYNFGQAVRALFAAGATGLVVRPRNWMSAAAVVARASAGASERLPTAVAETAQDAADKFRARGLLIAVTDVTRAVDIYETDLTAPLFLLVGGEKRGVTRAFADAADVRLRIPYGREFRLSLGTAGAAAVLAFEVMRQRRARK